MRNIFSQWYDGQAAQRGCLSAPISHSIRRIAKHPCRCQLGNLTLHSRTRVKCEHAGLLTGLVTSWDCGRGFDYQELFPFNFLALDRHPARCEIKLSSKGVDSVHRCTVGVQPPCRAGFSFALLCDVCIARCLQQPRFLKWKHLMLVTATREQNKCLNTQTSVSANACATGSFLCDAEFSWQKYSQKHKFLSSVCSSHRASIFNVLRAALWWLQSWPKHWGWTGTKAKSPVYSNAN